MEKFPLTLKVQNDQRDLIRNEICTYMYINKNKVDLVMLIEHVDDALISTDTPSGA
jgi:hypothetical protein